MQFSIRLAVAVVIISCAAAGQNSPTVGRSFSVRDSIEMTTFSDPFIRNPGAVSKLSPDKKHFLVVTTKGLFESNQLRSELWIYDSASVASYLQGNAPLPRTKLLSQLEATPRARQLDSYGSLITEAHWSSDSSAIFFLGEQGDGIRRLYRVSLDTGSRQLITGDRQDVIDFDESNGTVAYSVQEDDSEDGLEVQFQKNAVDLTGLTISQILQPHRSPPNAYPLDRNTTVWMAYTKDNLVPERTELSERWYLPVSLAATRFHLAISPNGRYLIAARPVEAISPSWRNYLSARTVFRYDALPTTWNTSIGPWDWPWQYVLVDMESKSVFPLVDSPSAILAGYGEPFQVAWSEDGTRVLFTSTFLPLDGGSVSERSERERPCSVAVFSLSDRQTRCVTFTLPPADGRRLISAFIESGGKNVGVTWTTSLGQQRERFEEKDGRWGPTDQHAIANSPFPVTLAIKQDLNQTPTLWANDLLTGVSKLLWDPNPQINSLQLGEASVYQWKDKTGYEWKAALIEPPNYIHGHHYPLVIYTHGFRNEHEFLVDGAFTTGFAARALAAAGIVVLQVEDRRDRYARPATEEASSEVAGFMSAIESLAEQNIVDPEKVGIVGFSRTSWYAETALVEQPGLFQAASIIDGADESYMQYMLFCPFDFECQLEGSAVHGGPPHGPHLSDWLTSAVSFHLDQIHTPVRLEAISLVSVLGEWEIYSALTQLHKPVDLIYIPHGQHILEKPQERYASQQGNVDWFRFWLQGYEDPDPTKSDQYRRWRALQKLDTVTPQIPDGRP